MELFFSPLACSMAARIALYEAGAPARFVEVDTRTKRMTDGGDYRDVHPLGLVPLLRTDDGMMLTESAAILQYIADHHAPALAPSDPLGRTRLHQWLSFIGTELHKGTFAPLLDQTAPEDAKAYALRKGEPRLSFVAQHLEGRSFLLDDFSVADAYLFTVLVWTAATSVDLSKYPPLRDYFQRLRDRPSIARAFGEERELYAAENARSRDV